MSATTPPGGSRGRPRDPNTDHAIAAAVGQVLIDKGYSALSYDQVASAAGVSRPTLYLRANSKAALVVTALVKRYGLTPVPDTGNLRDDLLCLQRQQVSLYSDPAFLAALPGILTDIRTDQRARSAWNDGFVHPRRRGVHVAVQRAAERGEIEGNIDCDWICDLLTGPLISVAFLQGPRALPDALAEQTVTTVLHMTRRP